VSPFAFQLPFDLPLEPVTAVLAIPLLSAALLALLPWYWLAARLNVAAALATFLAALFLLVQRPDRTGYLFIDDLNVVFVVLGTFVGFTTSAFSASYIGHELEVGRLTPRYLRFYHAMYQMLMFAMNLALVSNNIGLMWVAVELATLTTVAMVGIYRTHEALEAAWKYFILGSVGIALALFGTILVYMAARPVVGEGHDAMVWTTLIASAAGFSPELLNVAFIFLMLGYGTKVGLAPLHAWLPDAHAEGPTPISAVLSGLLLNVALYAVLRFKMLLAANPAAISPGPLMVTMGLVSVVFAAFMLYRRRDIKRFFAYSSIEHMGIITFAFGMGGAVANFAALLHMTVHSLTKSAIFFTAGHAAQKSGSQLMDHIRGLITLSPTIGWGLMMGSLAILGVPPFGVFASEFLILTTAMREQPWATPILLAALGVAFAAIFGRVQPMVFGETSARRLPHAPALLPVFLHLGLVLALGLYIPPYLAEWYRAAARLIGGG
jgi:hydrogenase-4 component F